MSDSITTQKLISQLGAVSGVNVGDLVPITQGSTGPNTGTTRKATVAALLALVPTPPTPAYIYRVFFPGIYTTNAQVLDSGGWGEEVALATNWGGQLRCLVAPTANANILMKQNGSTIGTGFIAAGATTGTWAANATTIAATDLMQLLAPAAADATLAGLQLTLVGTRGS